MKTTKDPVPDSKPAGHVLTLTLNELEARLFDALAAFEGQTAEELLRHALHVQFRVWWNRVDRLVDGVVLDESESSLTGGKP